MQQSPDHGKRAVETAVIAGEIDGPLLIDSTTALPAPGAPVRSFQAGLVVAIFIASGAAGLIYQVAWSSQLVLTFGNTTEAIGAIVSAFMAGLGFGGLVGGLIAPKLRQPLRLYGLVELAIAITALLVPFGFQAIDNAYRSAYGVTSPATLTLLRVGLALVTLAPATFLMGLTLPLLTRHLVTSLRTAGQHLGGLYAANTAGAMAGCLLSGFVLIELFGLSTTAFIAVALNVLAGGVALALSIRAPVAVSPVTSLNNSDEPPGLPQRLRRAVYASTFVSGFAALGLEVLWTRMLGEGTGSTTYQFVATLAAFLFGIAAGSAIYRTHGRRSDDSVPTLALLFLAVAVSAVITVPLATFLPGTNLLRALFLLPATTFMGYAFPLSARLVSQNSAHSARGTGFLYAWNTLGSILGTLVAAFILTATLGTNNSIFLLAAAQAAIAFALLVVSVPSLRSARFRLAAAGAMAVAPLALVLAGSPLALTSTQRWLNASGLPYYHTEDRLSTVDAVGGPPDGRTLYTSGTSMTYLSVETKLMAYIPKLARPSAEDFLVICFGMGTTFRSGLLLGMNTDAVELSPTVPLMMPTFYEDAEQFLRHPKARIITADGRNYLRLTSKKYDLITSDPPPPIETAGARVLYSREYYADVHRALKPGGVMLQWVYFGLDVHQLRQHMRTFRAEFPHMLVLINFNDEAIYMLGSDAPISWDSATVSRILESPEAKADIATAPNAFVVAPRPWAETLASMRWLQDGEVDRFVGEGPMITDDHPLTEYYLLHALRNSGQPQLTGTVLRDFTR